LFELVFLSTLVFTYFKGLYFSHSSILQFGKEHTIKQLPLASSGLHAPLIVTTDLMFREFLSFDKFHVEIDLMWFWR